MVGNFTRKARRGYSLGSGIGDDICVVGECSESSLSCSCNAVDSAAKSVLVSTEV